MRGAVEGRLLAMAMRSSTRQHRPAVSAVRAASSQLVTDFLHILIYSMVAFCTIGFGSLCVCAHSAAYRLRFLM